MTKAIVEFPKVRAVKATPLPTDATAEIIIFPGVRFERLTEPVAVEPLYLGDKPTRQMRTLFAELLES